MNFVALKLGANGEITPQPFAACQAVSREHSTGQHTNPLRTQAFWSNDFRIMSSQFIEMIERKNAQSTHMMQCASNGCIFSKCHDGTKTSSRYDSLTEFRFELRTEVFSSTGVLHSSYYTVRLASQIRLVMAIVNCHIFYLFNVNATGASVCAKTSQSPRLVNASEL